MCVIDQVEDVKRCRLALPLAKRAKARIRGVMFADTEHSNAAWPIYTSFVLSCGDNRAPTNWFRKWADASFWSASVRGVLIFSHFAYCQLSNGREHIITNCSELIQSLSTHKWQMPQKPWSMMGAFITIIHRIALNTLRYDDWITLCSIFRNATLYSSLFNNHPCIFIVSSLFYSISMHAWHAESSSMHVFLMEIWVQTWIMCWVRELGILPGVTAQVGAKTISV